MNMLRKVMYVLCLSVLLILASLLVGIASHRIVQAQGVVEVRETREVKPYAFAELPEGTHVYKMVHEGCEIFVAQSSGGHTGAVTIAITAGRGCK